MEKKIRKVAVVGTGILGSQIAIVASCFDYQVFAYDRDEGSFERALEKVRAVLDASGEKAMISIEDLEKGSRKIKFCTDLKEAVQEADLVIEAVPENLDMKREVFKKIDELAPPEAILATNSSSMPVSKIEGSTKRPEKCLNMHFYYPAAGVKMVDIMGGTRTTPEVIQAGKQWVRSIGCVPLTVNKEILGFCFNRVWRAIKRETLYMWAEGFVDFRDVDRAWMIFTGMPHGPFGIMDNVGLDVVYAIEMIYYNESKDPKDHPPEALKAKVDRNELGIKTGKGFYTHPDPEYARPDFLKG